MICRISLDKIIEDRERSKEDLKLGRLRGRYKSIDEIKFLKKILKIS